MYEIVPDTIANVEVPNQVPAAGVGTRSPMRSREGALHLKPGTLTRVTDDEFKAITDQGIALRYAKQIEKDIVKVAETGSVKRRKIGFGGKRGKMKF